MLHEGQEKIQKKDERMLHISHEKGKSTPNNVNHNAPNNVIISMRYVYR